MNGHDKIGWGRLDRLNREHYVAKLGGIAVGEPGNSRLHRIVPMVANQYGLPAGLVYSAAEGTTKFLMAVIESIERNKPIHAIRAEVKALFEGYDEMWDITRKGIRHDIGGGRHVRAFDAMIDPLEAKRLEEVKRLLAAAKDSLSAYRAAYRKKGAAIAADRCRAAILSLGERLMKTSIVDPLAEIMKNVFGIPVVSIDSALSIVQSDWQSGYSDLAPDIEQSIANLAAHLASLSESGAPPPFVLMPGYYMGDRNGNGAILTMPFNGSDLSAYLLAAALERSLAEAPVGLVYVKRIEGELELDAHKLMQRQKLDRERRGGIARELIMLEALELIYAESRTLRVFDAETGRRFTMNTAREKAPLTTTASA